MAASTWIESGEITEVYFPIGRFPSRQYFKYQQAPFVLTKLLNEEYVMPVSIGGSAEDLKALFATDAVTTEQIMGGNDFGFYNGSPMFSNENEWGGWQKEGLQGLHSFSRI